MRSSVFYNIENKRNKPDLIVLQVLIIKDNSIGIVDAFKSISDVNNLNSCSHGAGRRLSRTDTLKHWHSLKKRDREDYKIKFNELLDRSGEFPSGYIQEFDFAYKDSEKILELQPFLKKVTQTIPICTIKFNL